MIPKEYEFFCRLKKIEACSYVNSIDCPKTCNLSKKSQLEGDIESEINDVLGLDYNKYSIYDN